MASSLRDIEELAGYTQENPMPAGADIITQQEAVDALNQRAESARVAGTVTPFESSFNPTNPNFRQTIKSSLNNLFGGSNISSNPNYLQGRIANTLSGLVDFIPAVGDAVGVGDTITSYRQGDMLGTGINALATGVGVLPLVGGPASKAVKAGGNRVRMQRAQDLDFDTSRTAYRGLSGEYDPSKAGNYQMFTSSPEDASEYGSNVVSSYLRKGNNLVVDGGRNNFNSIPVRNLPDEVRANLHSSVGSVARTDDIAYAAQEAGYDSVSINNVFDKASNEIPLKPPLASNAPMSQEMMDLLDEVDASGMLNNIPDVALPPEIPRNYDPTTIDIIFDPKDIRSINAEFDPTKADSSDLLSSISPTQSSLRNIA